MFVPDVGESTEVRTAEVRQPRGRVGSKGGVGLHLDSEFLLIHSESTPPCSSVLL